jgi:hypothetical protein
MNSKCSLHDLNSYLQFAGLISLIIILIISVFYYLRIYHTNILEKYEDGSIDTKTIEYKNGNYNNRSTYPKDKYPGRNMDRISSDIEKKDKYKLRDCKVYFTDSKDNIERCDAQSDNIKTCSYTFNGWKEFDTYTDNYGNTINYPKKIYTNTKTNTNDFVNSDFTSKCFKKFDYDGLGAAQPFEYAENNLVKYDSKGTTDNTEKDTNIFNGLKYTSIQFLNKDNANDNFTNVLNSICSIKYNSIDSLKDKKFYKISIIKDNNENIINISKVKLNNEQTMFDVIKDDALFDFSILGSHGIRYDTLNRSLKIFIKSNISMNAKVYIFNYVSYICPSSQIKSYTTTNTDINISSFALFRNKVSNTSINFTLNNVNMSILDWSKYNTDDVDYKFAIIDDLNTKIDDRKKIMIENNKALIEGINSEIASKDADIVKAYSKKNNFLTDNKQFVDIFKLMRKDGYTRIFNYEKGYCNKTIKEVDLPNGSKCNYISSDEIYIEFNNTGGDQTKHTFIVPEGGYICDILLVGGGGAGGGAGGAGGGGDVQQFKEVSLAKGVYEINVGAGGETVGNNQAGIVGKNSTFSGNSIDLKAAGGGGGGGYGGYCADRYCNWKTDPASVKPTQVPTATFKDPYTGNELKTSGGGGGVRVGSGKKVEDGSSGSGGKNVDGNSETGGAGGGAASTSEGGDAGNSSRWWGLYTGDGGKGVFSSITGKSIEYGGGGSGARWNGGVDTYGTSSGGSGSFKDGNFIDVENNKGGGGIMYRKGGSGVVIIRIKNFNNKYDISINTDQYYKLSPVSQITFQPFKLQNNIITSFIFLQKGYYRFRVDVGENSTYANPYILYSELKIYDESNLNSTKYDCRTVFKYNKYNNVYKPSYLKQYIKITTSKFYKIAYYYQSYNNNSNNVNNNFNIYFKYLESAPVKLDNTIPPNLIAWYKFDSNYTIDSNPNDTKYNLVKNGSIEFTNDEERYFINTANGSLNSSINLARKSFSISVWRRTRNSGHSFFVLQGEQHGTNIYLHIGARNNNAYCLAFYANDLECGVGTGTASSYPEDVNNWVHLVYIVEETIDKKYNRKIYRNGSLISQDQSGTAFVGWGDLRLGNNINIDINNFIVFNRALSKEEVDTLYNNDYNSTSTVNMATTYIDLNNTNNNNDESLFTRNNLSSINVSANDYLFCGNTIYADYKNSDKIIMDLFTDINYNNNNYINYQKLANYINADPIDYFNITSLRNEKTSIEKRINDVINDLPNKVRNDVVINDITKLLNAINDIKYNELLPIDVVSKKTEVAFSTIFGREDYSNLLTYDRVKNYDSLISNNVNPNLSSSIYIEAIN